MKKITLLNLILFQFIISQGASRYWVASSSSSWNDASCWSATNGGSGGASIPGASDIARFTSAATGDCSISTNANVEGMNINGYSGTITQASGNSITIGSSGFIQYSGTFISNSDIDLNGEFDLRGGTLTLNSSSFYVSKDWLHSGGTFSCGYSTVVFDGSFTSPSGKIQMVSSNEAFYNLTFNLGAGSMNVFGNGDSLNVSNTLTFTAGSIAPWTSGNSAFLVSKGNFTVGNSFGTISPDIDVFFNGASMGRAINLNSNTSVLDGDITFRMQSGAATLYSNLTMNAAGILTFNAGEINFYTNTITNSTVNTVCNGNFTLSGAGTLNNYGWTQTSGSPTVSIPNDLNFLVGAGGVNVTSGSTTFGSSNISVSSNWVQTGTADYGTSTITFCGTSNQILNSTSSMKNLTINNTAGITLGSNISINGTLTLTAGRITLGSYNLIMASNSTLSGYSASSFVYTGGSGVFRWMNCVANSTKLFPVGHTNSSSGYTPIEIQFNNSHTTDNFNVLAIDKITYDGTRAGTSCTSNVVKTIWNITEASSGGSDVNIQFQWNGSDEAGGFSRSNCRMVHYSSAVWNYLGSLSSASGSGPYTYTYSNYTGTFSPFGISGGGTPLPVSLLYLKASKIENKGYITWATASEQNNDYFEIEKSQNGQNFYTLAKIKGAGNSSQIVKYQYIDSTLGLNTNYYRLKQTDYDGKFWYSPLAVLHNIQESKATSIVQLHPVPATKEINIDIICKTPLETELRIVNLYGKTLLITPLHLKEGMNTKAINLDNISTGIYFIQIDRLPDLNGIRFMVNK